MKPRPVTSLDDPALELFRALRDRDLRVDYDAYIVESLRVVRRFLRAVAGGFFETRGVLLSPPHAETLAEELRALPSDVPVHVAPLEMMIDLAGYRFHAGALAIGRRPTSPPTLEALLARFPDAGPLKILIAEGVSNMDNAGALLRDAAALGADGVLFGEGCSDPLLRKAIRVSMGRVFTVPWGTCGKVDAALTALHQTHGVQAVALENLPDATPIGEVRWPERVAIVVGNEGHGLREATLNACSIVARIPGPAELSPLERAGGGDELSLNVSVAAAVALYALNTAASTRAGSLTRSIDAPSALSVRSMRT